MLWIFHTELARHQTKTVASELLNEKHDSNFDTNSNDISLLGGVEVEVKSDQYLINHHRAFYNVYCRDRTLAVA